MIHWTKPRWPLAAVVGLVVGLILSGLLPHTPLHAVSTDRSESYAIATGPVDSDVEAVYVLDFLTGDLQALVLGRQFGTWTGFFATNVARDLNIDPQKNPKFMMVTGIAGMRRAGGSRQQWSAAACYVAEVSSGRLAAYTIPWTSTMHAAGQMQRGPLAMAGPPVPFRSDIVGGSTIGSGGVVPKGKDKDRK